MIHNSSVGEKKGNIFPWINEKIFIQQKPYLPGETREIQHSSIITPCPAGDDAS